MSIVGTPEQEAIWHAMHNDKRHLIVKAGPGTGKSFTIKHGVIQYAETNPSQNCRVIAFNKHIAKSIEADMTLLNAPKVISVKTFNGMGWAVFKKCNPRADVDEFKVSGIIDKLLREGMLSERLSFLLRQPLIKMIGLLKSSLLEPTRENIEKLTDLHDLDNGEDMINSITDYATEVMIRNLRDANKADFNDQIWMPLMKDWPIPQYDFVCVDEAQDTNRFQIELAIRAAATGRIVFLGDPFQSIYQFRGVSVNSMRQIEESLGDTERGVLVLPLTLTQRCPKANVRLAQKLFPHAITAKPDAPEGRIIIKSMHDTLAESEVGDMILSRTNAPLVTAIFTLFRLGKRAAIRGKRDVGKGILDIVEKVERNMKNLVDPSVDHFVDHLAEFEEKQVLKLTKLGERGEQRLQMLNDKIACIRVMLEESGSVSQLKAKMFDIFADFNTDGTVPDKIMLGTIHGTKGLEANTVVVLTPELLPHPMARSEDQKQQELNMLWVATTRTKFTEDNEGTTIFVGCLPKPLR